MPSITGNLSGALKMTELFKNTKIEYRLNRQNKTLQLKNARTVTNTGARIFLDEPQCI
jgi:hypothetical protein